VVFPQGIDVLQPGMCTMLESDERGQKQTVSGKYVFSFLVKDMIQGIPSEINRQ
jgi:hypothetical protein